MSKRLLWKRLDEHLWVLYRGRATIDTSVGLVVGDQEQGYLWSVINGRTCVECDKLARALRDCLQEAMRVGWHTSIGPISWRLENGFGQ